MPTDPNKKIFYHLLANTLVANITNTFIWLSLVFWVASETKSALLTSLIGGTFAVLNMFGAFFFGSVVDHNKKKHAMLFSSCSTLIAFIVGALVYYSFPDMLADGIQVEIWMLIIVLMIGVVLGNMRMIALSTLVTKFFTEGRDKANGMVGMVNGLSFTFTAALSGLAVGFHGMDFALICSVVATLLVIVHLIFIKFKEDKITYENEEQKKKFDFKGTIKAIHLTEGLFMLIFFTTFNNFLGGVFMALMDLYGLSLVSVQAWGTLFAVVSLGFLVGGGYIAKKGLGAHPLRRLLFVNVALWISCMFFTIQPSIVLLAIGMFIWMSLSPFIEATEQTIIQTVVPFERQGRVFGFAQSIESAAMPVTAFLIGPIAHFIFIPFMTTGAGVELIGNWFGTGPARGIALVFTLAGTLGLIVTLFAFRTKSYRILSKTYEEAFAKKKESEAVPAS